MFVCLGFGFGLLWFIRFSFSSTAQSTVLKVLNLGFLWKNISSLRFFSMKADALHELLFVMSKLKFPWR